MFFNAHPGSPKGSPQPQDLQGHPQGPGTPREPARNPKDSPEDTKSPRRPPRETLGTLEDLSKHPNRPDGVCLDN